MSVAAYLEAVGSAGGYVFGEAWERNASAVGESNALFFCSPESWMSTSVLSERAMQLAEFRESSRPIKFAEGMDIVGRCAETGLIVWESDVSVLPGKLFSRSTTARRSGLRQALAIPLAPAGGAVSRVLVLFAARPAELDRVQVETVLGSLAALPPLPAREQPPSGFPIFTQSVSTPAVRKLFGTRPGQRTAEMAAEAWQDLERVPFFRKFADVFHIIWRSASTLTLAACTPIFGRGDPGGACYLVLSGALRIARDDVYKCGSLLLPGDAAGESAMLHSRAHGPRCATVAAAEATELLVVELHTNAPHRAAAANGRAAAANGEGQREINGGSSSASSAGGSECGTATSAAVSPEIAPAWTQPSAACLHASAPLPPPLPGPSLASLARPLAPSLAAWPLVVAPDAAGRPRSAPPGPAGVPSLGSMMNWEAGPAPAVSAWQQAQAFQAELERRRLDLARAPPAPAPAAPAPPAAGRQAGRATREAVEACCHLPLKEAADRLGLSQNALRALSREYGLTRWPGRKRRREGTDDGSGEQSESSTPAPTPPLSPPCASGRRIARPASVPQVAAEPELPALRALQTGHLHSQSAPDLAGVGGWSSPVEDAYLLATARLPHTPTGDREPPEAVAGGSGRGRREAGASGRNGTLWSVDTALETPRELPEAGPPAGGDSPGGLPGGLLPPLSLLKASVTGLRPLDSEPAPACFTPSLFLIPSSTPSSLSLPLSFA